MSHTDTAFAFAVGGGVDIQISDGIWLRPIQLDYIRHSGANEGNQMRRFVGIVFGVGRR
jgi:hypothetical protein